MIPTGHTAHGNVRLAPAAIPLPSREAVEARCSTRAGADNAAWERQAARVDALVQAARSEGHAAGERAGYKAGWRWGVTCGLLKGGLDIAILWLLWAQGPAWLAAARAWLQA